MNKKIIITPVAEKKENPNNAGSKAREDLEKILICYGFQLKEIPLYRYQEMKHCRWKFVYKKIRAFVEFWRFFVTLKKDSVLFFHWPLGNIKNYSSMTFLLKKYKKLRTICALHDLNTLRFQGDFSDKEADQLKKFDVLIVHNEKMKALCSERGICEKQMYVLGVFDYCLEQQNIPVHMFSKEIAVAGNLAGDKAGYVNDLPEGSLVYHLYGKGYTGKETEHVQYHGIFLPDALADKMEGSFGLVWDGNDIDDCTGLGRYLKYNNPHKISLYLAAGLPVIIWKEAALAEWISNRKLGIAVERLDQIEELLDMMRQEEYEEMAENARREGRKLRQGKYFRQVMDAIEEEEDINGLS